LETPITVGRFDGSGRVSGFKTMKAALRHIDRVLSKEDPNGVRLGFYYLDAPEPDRFGRRWTLPPEKLCPTCGQPDSEKKLCLHRRIPLERARKLGAILE
jgi:hypothetical protein